MAYTRALRTARAPETCSTWFLTARTGEALEYLKAIDGIEWEAWGGVDLG